MIKAFFEEGKEISRGTYAFPDFKTPRIAASREAPGVRTAQQAPRSLPENAESPGRYDWQPGSIPCR